MRGKPAHEPTVEDGLSTDVDEPRKPRLVVVHDGQQSATAEHLAKLEPGFSVLPEEHTAGHVEQLSITAASLASIGGVISGARSTSTGWRTA